VSPKGDQVAFLDHPVDLDDQGDVAVVDLAGHKRILSTGWESEEGLAWSPGGTEVFFSATEAGLQRQIYAVDLKGKVRLSYRAPGGVTLEDIAPDGRLLLTSDQLRAGFMGLAPGATRELDLSWLDWSLAVDISADGKMAVLDEEGEQGGPNYTVAIRDMRGSPPVVLGEGMAGGFSPDGKWVAATVNYRQLVLLPTGAGTSKRLEPGDVRQYGHPVRWMPDGKQILFPGKIEGHATQCFVQSVDGGRPRVVTPEGVTGCEASPDGRWIAGTVIESGQEMLYPVALGQPQPVRGLMAGEHLAWTADSEVVYVSRWNQLPVKIYKLNLATGQRQLLKELNPPDATGLCDVGKIRWSADGRAYIYGYTRILSDLYLVKGVQ
jgi:Tol biopolymer transport system component